MRPRSLAGCIAATLFCVAPALAADDDRGLRGFFVASGGGLALGSAVDGEGEDAGSFFGNGGYLRLGEEVVPGMTLGLMFGGTGGDAESGRYAAGLGGFLLQVGWRPFADVVLTGGAGVGGGSIEPAEGDDPQGAAGGTLYQLGLAYEFSLTGGAHDGFGVAPALNWFLVPSYDRSPTRLSVFMVGLDGFWYAGR